MWVNIIFAAVRWMVGSGLFERIYSAIEDAQGLEMSGSDKWFWVWDQISGDSEVEKILVEKGKWAINLAIEAGVAKLKSL